MALNVLGTELVACSLDPLTGYFRDGCCNTDEHDRGLHVDLCPHDRRVPRVLHAGAATTW